MTPLDIFIDPVCPFCYIGKIRLDRALAARPDHGFSLAWHPFQLNPTMPAGGMARADYLEAKFGQDGAVGMTQQVMEICAAEEIPIDMLGVGRQPNTLDAHRLIHWAGLEEVQTSMVSALMQAFWVEGRDIGERAELVAIAQSVGLDAVLIERLLASDADREEVLLRDTHARERGIKAVPTFILSNTHAIEGAQPTQLWLEVITELRGAAPSAPRQ